VAISEMTVPQLVEALRDARGARVVSVFLLALGSAAAVALLSDLFLEMPAVVPPLLASALALRDRLTVGGTVALAGAWFLFFVWRTASLSARIGALRARLAQTRFDASR